MSVSDKLQQATEILALFGLPRVQINDRSAYTLLALLHLGPDDHWSSAAAPLIGITPIMTFTSEQYGKTYAPNTRETFRRQTMHQFVAAGLAVSNPDQPDRPINSPKWVYQVTPEALKVIRTFGTEAWETDLREFLASVGSLKATYAKAREMNVIPVKVREGKALYLTPGGQNVLVKEIIEQFAPRFTPDGTLLYAGDTGKKDALYDRATLEALGVVINDHGKIPDVIIHYTERNWLVLIEAVTSHGPIDGKRNAELRTLFSKSTAGLVMVTTFLDRKAMREFLPEISWETEVWIADAPDHLIHFNGERFLGPY